MQPEAILKLKPRPLRLAYLVNSVTDLSNAVTLYTHLWGGFSNAILPACINTGQSIDLQNALHSINPDYILLPEEEVSSDVNEILDKLPSYSLRFSSERIEAIANISDHLRCFPVRSLSRFNILEFPHIIRTLNLKYNNPLESSNFFLTSNDSLFDCEVSLLFGKPSSRYQDHLRNQLNARPIPITSIGTLLKTSLLASVGLLESSISITNTEIVCSESSGGWRTRDHEKVFNLFIYETGDLRIAASFWNSRRLNIGYSNKLLLPKESFIENLEECISLLSSFFPSMRELQIHIELSNEDAIALADNIHTIFGALERNVFVKLFYNDSGLIFESVRVYSSRPIITTREVRAIDKSIRFSPIVPSGYEDSSCAFGYDAEIEFSSGSSFSMPTTQFSAVLLSNFIEQVEHLENSTNLRSRNGTQQKTQPVRSAAKGVAGIAVSNEECHIYLPDSKDIIARWLKDLGFLFEANDHTRYAQGFIKRFGGFDQTKYLINSGGAKIFIALGSRRAKQCGLSYSGIVSFLAENFNLNDGAARQVVDQNLLKLLKAGLIYRGHPLKCPSCGLKDWYKLDKISEFVECIGCTEHFQLQDLDDLEFAYKSNELAARFLHSGGSAILQTAVFLSWFASSGHTQLGGDLTRLGENQPFAEIDLFVLVRDILILAECKSCRVVNEAEASKIIVHLKRVVETAILVNARAVVLGVSTASIECDLCFLVADVAQTAAERGVGVHLLINDDFYLFGERENQVTESWELNIETLLVQKEPSTDYSPVFVGEPVIEYSWEEGDRLVNRDLLECWKQELYP